MRWRAKTGCIGGPSGNGRFLNTLELQQIDCSDVLMTESLGGAGHGSKRNGGALSCLSGGGGLSWTGGMRRLAGASSPTPAGGDSAEGPLKLEGSLPAANDLVPGSSPGGLLRSGSRPLQRIREESSQVHPLSCLKSGPHKSQSLNQPACFIGDLHQE